MAWLANGRRLVRGEAKGRPNDDGSRLAFGALSCLRLVASLTSATIAEGARPCRSASLRSCLKASSLAVRVPRPFCQLSRATPEGRNDSLTSSQRCVT